MHGLAQLAAEVPRRCGKKLTGVLEAVLSGVSENRSKIAAAYRERGLTPPTHIESPDPMPEEYRFYWGAFCELRSCSDGAIPWTAMDQYARLYQVRDFDIFLEIIRRLESHLRDKKQSNG